MKIGARIERVNKPAITRKLREYAQFDLRIVRNDQLASFRVTTETAPVLNRMRHLLNIRVSTRKPSRRRADLSKVCVQAFGQGIDQLDHVFAVTRQRFLNRAVLEQRADDRILRGERL